MRKITRLALVLLAAGAALSLEASTPPDACAQQTCPGGCGGGGNTICNTAPCGYMWVAIE